MESKTNFIWDIIEDDLQSGKHDAIHTRFPPEPNGYLHIGHCKAFLTNFHTANRYKGFFNLRFDDTNPEKEESEYVDSIIEDLTWMGCEWNGGLFYASDYFETFYQVAESLIKKDLAYVDELTSEQMREYRGSLTAPGKNSPYRDRPVEESLALFQGMRNGDFEEGKYVLRAKIDMTSPNMNMRDPALYRINYAAHHRTGSDWVIYPMYDFAHPLEDAIEGITHSLCSLEFEDHRPLYDWVVEHSQDIIPNRPRQIEFARLNLTQTVMSKRYLRRLVEEGYVTGWDDPRLPTLAALRRRGYRPQAIANFIEQVGVSKADSMVDLAFLDFCVREDLEQVAPRTMAVIRPLKVVLTNWPEEEVLTLTVDNHPAHPEMGTTDITFGKELYIEQDDFMKEPVRKFFRMYPGNEVRLRGAYIVKCDSFDTDENGEVTTVYCTVDLDSLSGSEGAARKVKGTLHWVHAQNAIPIEARLYEPLLLEETEENADKDFIEKLNPNSLTVVHGFAQKDVRQAAIGDTYQFMRLGYFTVDTDTTPEKMVFNRTVGLRDSWAKVKNK
ncbi:MAG: glutamine--tRNA ligase/YqeY domain fusion protein [Clostridiales bacterium]|nr:glutamine--tRNA ligase/YqeY domain fusion protein [Clostridiales bacterium]